jgi:signal transduction histidine kinase
VDLGELAETLLQRASALGDRRWVLDAAPRPGLIAAVGDQGRLVQAALNLAANAAQHTGPGDEIGIGVALVDGDVHLWVRDTGPGVDPSVADHLFTRYARGVTSRIGRPDGMGLGLSIVDAIARAHAGHVSLDSEPGRGATFTIVVPLDAGAAGDVDDDPWPAPAPSDAEPAGGATPSPSPTPRTSAAPPTSPRAHVEEHS